MKNKQNYGNMSANIRRSAEKLNIAVKRLIVVATRGFDKTFFI
jgi:hypothetical protein